MRACAHAHDLMLMLLLMFAAVTAATPVLYSVVTCINGAQSEVGVVTQALCGECLRDGSTYLTLRCDGTLTYYFDDMCTNEVRTYVTDECRGLTGTVDAVGGKMLMLLTTVQSMQTSGIARQCSLAEMVTMAMIVVRIALG